MKTFLEVLTDVRIATGEIGGTICLIFLVSYGIYKAWREFIANPFCGSGVFLNTASRSLPDDAVPVELRVA
jgi:hypothetical protein